MDFSNYDTVTYMKKWKSGYKEIMPPIYSREDAIARYRDGEYFTAMHFKNDNPVFSVETGIMTAGRRSFDVIIFDPYWRRVQAYQMQEYVPRKISMLFSVWHYYRQQHIENWEVSQASTDHSDDHHWAKSHSLDVTFFNENCFSVHDETSLLLSKISYLFNDKNVHDNRRSEEEFERPYTNPEELGCDLDKEEQLDFQNVLKLCNNAENLAKKEFFPFFS